MDDATGGQVMFGIMAGISSLGFYIFLAVWVATVIWSRTKEKLAVQETLRKLIDSGAPLTPEVIDALRRPKPRRPPTPCPPRCTPGRPTPPDSGRAR